MKKELALKIANEHVKLETGTVTYYVLSNGKYLHVQTISEPFYYDDTDLVTYIDTEDENGDCIETHTAHADNIDSIAYWIYNLCYDTDIVH